MKKYTNKGSRLGIIRYMLHPYCFQVMVFQLQRMKDGHINFVLWLCIWWTDFSDQSVAA